MSEFIQRFEGRSIIFISKFWLVVSCFVFALFFLLFQGGKLAFMLFIVVTVITIYLSLGKWSGISKTIGNRTLVAKDDETRLEAGASMSVKVDIQIPGLWPIPYVFIRDHLERRNGEKHVFEASLVPDWLRRGAVEYNTPPLRRGLYRFTSTECSTEDVFGIFEHKGVMELPRSFCVLPQTVAIREWQQLHHMLKGMLHQSTSTRALRETTQINGIREYNYGDRLSRVHWKSTARTGTWKSKEFEKESLPRTILVLDRNQNNYKNVEEFELAVSVAASLFSYASKRNLALGLLSVGKEMTYIEPKISPYHHKSILNHLIEVEANGSYSLSHVLSNRIRSFTPGTFVTVISPLGGDNMLKMMGFIRQNQMNPCHFWTGELSREGKAWMMDLRAKGYMGYSVPTLQDLPHVLGGRGL